MVQGRGIELILLNYPGIKADVSHVLRNISMKRSIPFVDNHLIFMELRENKDMDEEFYALDGHCNATGYRIMAENLYHKIQEINLPERLEKDSASEKTTASRKR